MKPLLLFMIFSVCPVGHWENCRNVAVEIPATIEAQLEKISGTCEAAQFLIAPKLSMINDRGVAFQAAPQGCFHGTRPPAKMKLLRPYEKVQGSR
jgi:hypothetical protein